MRKQQPKLGGVKLISGKGKKGECEGKVRPAVANLRYTRNVFNLLLNISHSTVISFSIHPCSSASFSSITCHLSPITCLEHSPFPAFRIPPLPRPKSSSSSNAFTYLPSQPPPFSRRVILPPARSQNHGILRRN